MPTRLHRLLAFCVLGLAVAACGRQEEAVAPVVTPALTLSRADAPIGSPVQMTYRFAVAPSATFGKDYLVFVHFLDADRELMWTDDHQPPTPTSQWKGGATIEYTRTMFIPRFPYVGETTVQIGLHDPATGERLPMDAPSRGLREYDLATFNLTSQSEAQVVVFKDGWQPAEVSGEGVGTEWQWSRKEGVLAFRNPMRDATLYLQLDQPVPNIGPQPVEVRIGDAVVDSFTLAPGVRELRTINLTGAQLGTAEAVDAVIVAGRVFVPAEMPELRNPDVRELGVRVFRAYLDVK